MEKKKVRSQPGFEPGTTSTLKTYHTPRPLGLPCSLAVISNYNQSIYFNFVQVH